jgi:hypothetical protein
MHCGNEVSADRRVQTAQSQHVHVAASVWHTCSSEVELKAVFSDEFGYSTCLPPMALHHFLSERRKQFAHSHMFFCKSKVFSMTRDK